MPKLSEPVIFLGDSLTWAGRWSELFPELSNVLNRGVPGDTTHDVLARLAEVTARAPRVLILMIGTNDLLGGASIEATLRGVREILARVAVESSATRCTVLGIPPARERDEPTFAGFNARARSYNRSLAALAEELRVGFVDHHARLAGPDGELREELTYDGLHLLPEAYAQWATWLRADIPELSEH